MKAKDVFSRRETCPSSRPSSNRVTSKCSDGGIQARLIMSCRNFDGFAERASETIQHSGLAPLVSAASLPAFRRRLPVRVSELLGDPPSCNLHRALGNGVGQGRGAAGRQCRRTYPLPCCFLGKKAGGFSWRFHHPGSSSPPSCAAQRGRRTLLGRSAGASRAAISFAARSRGRR